MYPCCFQWLVCWQCIIVIWGCFWLHCWVLWGVYGVSIGCNGNLAHSIDLHFVLLDLWYSLVLYLQYTLPILHPLHTFFSYSQPYHIHCLLSRLLLLTTTLDTTFPGSTVSLGCNGPYLHQFHRTADHPDYTSNGHNKPLYFNVLLQVQI